MVVKDKNVLVFGSGISGEAACELLLKEEAKVVLYDGNDKLNPEEIRAKIEGGDSESLEIVLGTLEGDRKEELLDKLSFVVMSPGVPTDLPIVNEMREKGLPIWGEIELAYVFGKGDVLAITGTNGKTTTTSLLGEIMKNYAQSSFVVGNIGNPYTSIALQTREDSVISARNNSDIPSESQRDPEYYSGSSEPPSYDGSIHRGKGKYCEESDRERYLCSELRR